MKKYWYKAVLMITAIGALTACSDDDEIPEGGNTTTVTSTLGTYIINTGDYGQNNGSVQWYDPEEQTVSNDLYAAANGKGIGDVQDLCAYGTKVYIACSSSAKIEVVNRKDFKIAQTINLANSEGQAIQPRYLTAAEGNVYFTAYDGTVSKIDTTSLSITSSIEVGDHPEALTAANGKLYINISGYGQGKTIAVVDIATFSKKKDLEVVLDPYDTCFTGDDGKVYFISCGDFGKTISGTLQCIDPETDAVTTVIKASKAAIKDGKIYYISADYYSSDPGVIGVYDTDTKENKEFVAYDTFSTPQFIAVDPVSGEVYIGNYTYGVTNDIYVYSNEGTLKQKFETGHYTTNVHFVTEEKTVTE